MFTEEFYLKFWSKVNKNGPIASPELGNCWLWTGHIDCDGYGRVKFRGKVYGSHRIAYQNVVGDIPEDICVCHKCDVRGCCNPEHLFLGTKRENSKDMEQKDRVRHGTAHPKSKLTEEQVREIRFKNKIEKIGTKKLGTLYGVNRSTIIQIVRNEIWKRVV